jgi:hypothetical protein
VRRGSPSCEGYAQPTGDVFRHYALSIVKQVQPARKGI